MNKNIAIVITAVILLGMGLVTYNEYTTPVAPPLNAENNTAENTLSEEKNDTSLSSSHEENQNVAMEKVKSQNPVAPMIPAAPAPKPTPTAAPTLAVKAPPAVAPTQAPKVAPAPVEEAQKKAEALLAEKKEEAAAAAKAAQAKIDASAKSAQNTANKVVNSAKPAEDPVQKALEASRKESTLPVALTKPSEQKTAPKVAKTIKKITVIRAGDGTTVRLDSSEVPQYKTMRLTSPERLVLDLDGTWKLRAPGVPPNNFVSNVRIGDHKEGTRIVIDLKKIPGDIRYLKYGETGLDVRIR